MSKLTLNIRNTLLENLLQGLWIFELLGDFRNDRICEFFLLPCFHLTFVAYPGVEDLLCLMNQRSFLFEFEGLCFELYSLLDDIQLL